MRVTSDSNFRTNIELKIENSNVIEAGYSNSLKKNINKASKQNLTHELITNVDKFIRYFESFTLPKVASNSYNAYEFKSILNKIKEENRAHLHILKSENGIVAYAFISSFNNRYTLLLSGVSDDGKPMKAMDLLLHKVLHHHVGKDHIFDFEGSDIPGVKKFFLKYGGEEKKYPEFKVNNFPFPFNYILKR